MSAKQDELLAAVDEYMAATKEELARVRGLLDTTQTELAEGCLHHYENDQHYDHDGPHEFASWREVVQLRGQLATVTAARNQIEAMKPHIPPSTDPKRRDAIVGRSTLNQVLRLLDAALVGVPTKDSPDEMVGYPMRLDREEWGVIIDALIEHRVSAGGRKAVNSESTSDLRVGMCDDLIKRIGDRALSPVGSKDSTDEATE